MINMVAVAASHIPNKDIKEMDVIIERRNDILRKIVLSKKSIGKKV